MDPYEEMWQHLPVTVEETARDIALPTKRVKEAVAGVYTGSPVGVWYSPIDKAYALEVPESATPQDIQLAKVAVELTGELADVRPTYEDGFIKVAFTPQMGAAQNIADNPYTPQTYPSGQPPEASSPTLRHTAEYLQFLPKRDSHDIIPGYGPVNGMLAGGLVGAGLGYGAGWLAERFLPEKWKKKRLRRTLGLLGGAVGAAPGAIFSAVNMANGRRPWDNAMFSDQVKAGELSDRYRVCCDAGAKLLWDARREAFESAFDMEGVKMAETKAASLDVNVDEMGQTLWEVGADPRTAATTMSTLYAAHQMPGGHNRPGFVTPMQMANLGAHMGVGYVSGGLVGAALGALTGADAGTKDRLKQTGMYLGVVRAVVPKLFG